MLTSSFDYHLPQKLIAVNPVVPRDACRLMVLNRDQGIIEHRKFYHLEDYLRSGDVLVFNDSRVIPARIVFNYKGKSCELFLTKRLDDGEWLALVRPGKWFRSGVRCAVSAEMWVDILGVRAGGQRHIRFLRKKLGNFSPLGAKIEADFLRNTGQAPLPPYIKGSRATFDDYQTVYAREGESVAAPTAGLHFTPRLLNRLHQKGVQLEFATLHVGLGTFLPVKSKHIADHTMHSETYELPNATAKRLTQAKHEGRRIIAVGTTSVRVLEDSYDISRECFIPGWHETNIFIAPGYKWKVVDGLITNFHLPKSSLLMLVAAFAGKDFIFHAYREAIQKSYRFYSFGDAMLLL